jgi:hypothetical protein
MISTASGGAPHALERASVTSLMIFLLVSALRPGHMVISTSGMVLLLEESV